MKISLVLTWGLLVCSAALVRGEEASEGRQVSGSQENGRELIRPKKDLAKIQSLLGWKQKPYPILNLEEIKRPIYYPVNPAPAPLPCNCDWRPSARYPFEAGVVVTRSQPAQPAFLPAQPALAAALVIPARPAQLSFPGPVRSVIPAEPARAAPPPPQPPVIPAQPAIITADQPPCQDGYRYDRPGN